MFVLGLCFAFVVFPLLLERVCCRCLLLKLYVRAYVCVPFVLIKRYTLLCYFDGRYRHVFVAMTTCFINERFAQKQNNRTQQDTEEISL